MAPRPEGTRHPRLLAVLGDPVEHSLSPPMHNAAFRATGLPFTYIAVRVGPGELRRAVDALRVLGARGANVTVPHKEAAAQLAEWLSAEAREAGAVNTLVFEEGRVLGYSTDGAGFCRALDEVAHFDPAGRRVVLLGAGGAARAVALALAARGAAAVRVVNRTQERARALVERILASGRGTEARACPWPQDTPGWEDVLRGGDLVVQATSLGLARSGPDPWRDLPFQVTAGTALATDLIYGPGGSPFLRAAARAGLRTLAGDWMLLYQGAEAFRLWTGVEAPVALMRSVLDRLLKGGSDVGKAHGAHLSG
ncbi:shikimate dehydrogenase [Limnochorda pilosa]|uniref:Shikimate dehydrogenase (NADP(+)) n=1 Tax=Limnochorda pilosa TaxID=1555112 RepID=A0A0K2SQQ0_LIMPI|nr:shikimate dehydrogenase [Limnochorda pilosa]BAS29431.1 shikimate dehydrogenase [Limnochorda pilosa]